MIKQYIQNQRADAVKFPSRSAPSGNYLAKLVIDLRINHRAQSMGKSKHNITNWKNITKRWYNAIRLTIWMDEHTLSIKNMALPDLGGGIVAATTAILPSRRHSVPRAYSSSTARPRGLPLANSLFKLMQVPDITGLQQHQQAGQHGGGQVPVARQRAVAHW